jgi:hypothetical protein
MLVLSSRTFGESQDTSVPYHPSYFSRPFLSTPIASSTLSHRPYSPNLVELRERIRNGNVLTLGLVSYLEDHYSAVHLLVFEGLKYGNSLHLTVAPDLVPILRWAFAGLLGFELLEGSHPKTGLVDKQSIAAGGGSWQPILSNVVLILMLLSGVRGSRLSFAMRCCVI